MGRSEISEVSSQHTAGRERFCECGIQAPIKTAWTWDNFGRRFYTCSNYKVGKKCRYFEWYDPQLCDQGRRAVRKIRELQTKSGKDIDRYRAREKVLIFLLIVSWMLVIMFGMMLISAYKRE